MVTSSGERERGRDRERQRASGGGTADRTIRFWNILTGQCLQSVDTGSQVYNLSWSHSSSEFVSTHGYSQNQIIIWRYPSLVQIAKLTGHTTRVLYLVSGIREKGKGWSLSICNVHIHVLIIVYTVHVPLIFEG